MARRDQALRGLAFAAALSTAIGVSAPARAASFEGLAAEATAAPPPATLVAALAEDCGKARREIDRARCRGARGFFQRHLARRALVAVVDDPHVVSVSAFDAGTKGFRVRLVGCLTCSEPVQVGTGGDRRFVTLKVPAKGAETMGLGVEMARPSVTFATLEEARTWEAKVKPHLRAQFVFRPTAGEWTYRGFRGLAFTPVAARIFNRCTGEVLYSEPPSDGRVPVGEDRAGTCKEAEAPGHAEAVGSAKLTAAQINGALQAARGDIAACDEQFKMKGTLLLDISIAGAGGPATALKTEGPLAGTGVARCVLDAVRKVQFPAFGQPGQSFKYPVPLQAR